MSTRYTSTGEIYRPTEAAAMRELVRREREKSARHRRGGVLREDDIREMDAGRLERDPWENFKRYMTEDKK